MENVSIKEGMALQHAKTNQVIRLLTIFDGNVYACKCGITKLEILYFSVSELLNAMKKEEYLLLEEQTYLVDQNMLSASEYEKFLQYRSMCENVYSEYKYHIYDLASKKPKPIIDKYISDYKISRQYFWKIFIRYLQSGMRESSLIDQRRFVKHDGNANVVSAGRKNQNGKTAFWITEEDKKKFKKYLRKYLNSEVKTKDAAYLDLIEHEYSTVVKTLNVEGVVEQKLILLPPEQRPSRRQFFYYIEQHSTEQQRKEAKKTAAVVRNNNRVFTGTVMEGVRGPGHFVECDAQEMDIALISDEYEQVPVGRPILYIMIDVMSEIILGVSLAMDNNSIVGLTNCFLNLIEDKEQLIEKYTGTMFEFDNGITMNDIWPTGYKPRVCKFDNGSDFVSKPIARMAGELGIRLEHVSPASGSLKPLVESFFGIIKKDLDDLLEHKGLIRKTYNSKHHEEACLTYREAFALVLNQVIEHNSHVLKTYPKSADMKRKGLIASPMNLWRYGCDTMFPPEKFYNQEEVLYKLCLPAKGAKISRNGITFKNMPYFNSADIELQREMFRQGTSKTKFECRYDPRDMGHLYYLRDGKMMAASLPQDFRYTGYFDMSEKRFDELEKLSKSQELEEEELNLQARINKRRQNRQIIDNAAKRHTGKNEVKELRESRKEEKEIISGDNSIAERFDVVPKEESSVYQITEPILKTSSKHTLKEYHTKEKNHSTVQIKREDGDTMEDLKRKMMQATLDKDYNNE